MEHLGIKKGRWLRTASEAPAEPPATSRAEEFVRGGECEAAQLTAIMPEEMIFSRLYWGASG